MVKEVSPYKNNYPASFKKHFFMIITDFFTLFIVNFIFFSIFYPISVTNGYGKELSNNIANLANNMDHYLNDTHLRFYDENNKTMSDVNNDASNYLTNVIKTSAYVNNLNYPLKKEDGNYDMEHKVNIEETFLNDALNYPLDNISYYILRFKTSEPSINDYVLDDIDYRNDKETYQYNKIMKYDNFSTLLNEIFINPDSELFKPYKNLVSHFVVLNKTYAEAFINKVVFNENLSSEYENIFNSIKNSYISAINFGVNELENKCEPYMAYNNEFKNNYQNLTMLLFIILLASYIFSYLVLTLIMRPIAKRWITLGMKIFKLDFADKNEMEPGFNLIIWHVITLIMYFPSILLVLMFSGLLGILQLPIMGPITVIMLIIFILTLDFISFIFMLVRKNHQTLGNFLSQLIIKDTTEFEGAFIDGSQSSDESKPTEN